VKNSSFDGREQIVLRADGGLNRVLAFGLPDYSPKDTFKSTGTQRDAMARDFRSEHNVLHLWTLPDVVDNHVATA
jgi:hypothetical protein